MQSMVNNHGRGTEQPRGGSALFSEPPGLGSGSSTGGESTIPGGAKRRLLFVEGDTGVAQQFCRMVQERSRAWEIVPAGTAAEAMATLKHKSFDGVVASARLPGA